MSFLMNRHRQVLFLPVILQLLSHTSNALYLGPQKVLNENWFPQKVEEKQFVDAYYEETPDIYERQVKSKNQVQMFNVDLSRLRKDLVPSRHKLPMNLVGVDISVLSRNPDPSLPLVSKMPKDKMNGNNIMGYNFDSFDRLPAIKTKLANNYAILPKEQAEKPSRLLPMMFVPLSAMTTYHSILDANNQGTRDVINPGSGNELEHTANFILHLLNELSSDSRGDAK